MYLESAGQRSNLFRKLTIETGKSRYQLVCAEGNRHGFGGEVQKGGNILVGECLIPANQTVLDAPQLVFDVDKANGMDVRKTSLCLPFGHLPERRNEATWRKKLTLVTKSIPRPVEDMLKMFLTSESH